MIFSGLLPEMGREAVWFLPCLAFILLAKRLPVVQIGTVRLTMASAVVCAIVLWIGPFTATVVILLACWLEARLFVATQIAKFGVLKSGLALSAASIAAGFVKHAGGSSVTSDLTGIPLCLAAWQSVAPILLTFLSVYAAARLLASPGFNVRSDDFDGAPIRLRAGITLCGFSALLILAPIGLVLAAWTLIPLAGLLAAFGAPIHFTLEISRQRRQLSINQAMAMISFGDAAPIEPTALLYRFLALAQQLVHSARGLVWLLEEPSGELVPVVGLPDLGEFAASRIRPGEGWIGTAAERTRPLIVTASAQDLMCSQTQTALDSWLLYPIVVHNRVLGVAQWTRPAELPFLPEEAAQLDSLAPQVGVALESLRARTKMSEKVATDSLTGLLNQGRISELLREEMQRAQRYNRPLSVLMLDIDSFKRFNDTYGHLQGDALLRKIAHELQSGVRSIDKVGRFGGEEFIVVMPETHKDVAFLIAERVRTLIAENGFVVISEAEAHSTVSVGVASYPEDGLNPQELLHRADEALYRAKHAGKNCVIWA